jgi:hypothetical protein
MYYIIYLLLTSSQYMEPDDVTAEMNTAAGHATAADTSNKWSSNALYSPPRHEYKQK